MFCEYLSPWSGGQGEGVSSDLNGNKRREAKRNKRMARSFQRVGKKICFDGQVLSNEEREREREVDGGK